MLVVAECDPLNASTGRDASMGKRTIIMAPAICLSLIGAAPTANAQDASEFAIILGGSNQAGANGSLGSAIANSFNAAGRAVSSAGSGNTQRVQSNSRIVQARSARSISTARVAADPLAGSGASAYRTTSGATISVSGLMTAGPGAVCVRNCR